MRRGPARDNLLPAWIPVWSGQLRRDDLPRISSRAVPDRYASRNLCLPARSSGVSRVGGSPDSSPGILQEALREVQSPFFHCRWSPVLVRDFLRRRLPHHHTLDHCGRPKDVYRASANSLRANHNWGASTPAFLVAAGAMVTDLADRSNSLDLSPGNSAVPFTNARWQVCSTSNSPGSRNFQAAASTLLKPILTRPSQTEGLGFDPAKVEFTLPDVRPTHDPGYWAAKAWSLRHSAGNAR